MKTETFFRALAALLVGLLVVGIAVLGSSAFAAQQEHRYHAWMDAHSCFETPAGNYLAHDGLKEATNWYFSGLLSADEYIAVVRAIMPRPAAVNGAACVVKAYTEPS